MAKEILNRRQNIYAEDIPPEIVDTTGFIKATSYATGTTGGTVKVDSTYAIELTSGGKLKAKEIASEDYSAANDGAFVSKATLDNVIATLPSGGMTPTLIYHDTVSVSSTPTDLIVLSDGWNTDIHFLSGYVRKSGAGAWTFCCPVDSTYGLRAGTGINFGEQYHNISMDLQNDGKTFKVAAGGSGLSGDTEFALWTF